MQRNIDINTMLSTKRHLADIEVKTRNASAWESLIADLSDTVYYNDETTTATTSNETSCTSFSTTNTESTPSSPSHQPLSIAGGGDGGGAAESDNKMATAKVWGGVQEGGGGMRDFSRSLSTEIKRRYYPATTSSGGLGSSRRS